MTRSLPTSRHQAIETLRRQLQREGWPRLQMLLLVMVTGGAGFVASWGLLQGGYHAMWLRYPLALGTAYLVFLFLLWLWMRTHPRDWTDAWDGTVPDFPPSGGHASGWSGHGGGSGGGGASASFESSASRCASTDADGSAIDAIARPIGEAVGSAAEAEELAIPLMAAILAGVVCGTAGGRSSGRGPLSPLASH